MLHIWKEATVNSATQIGYNLKIYTCMRCGLTYEGGRNKNCSWSYVRTPDNYKIDVAERPVRDCSKCKKCESCQVNKTCYCDYIGVTIELIDDHARKERKTIPARTRGVVAKAVPEGGTPFGGWGPRLFVDFGEGYHDNGYVNGWACVSFEEIRIIDVPS